MSDKIKCMESQELSYAQKVTLFACEAIEELAKVGFINGPHYHMKARTRFTLEALKSDGFEPDEQDVLNCAAMMRDELGFTVVGEKTPIFN